MNLEMLKAEMIKSMKEKNKTRKDVISSMISAVKNKAIEVGESRENPSEKLIEEVILKEKKTMQEMIDTCPAARADLLAQYEEKMAIIKEFAPSLMETPEQISAFIRTLGIEISAKNRGVIMKALKGRADMKVANSVLQEMLK